MEHQITPSPWLTAEQAAAYAQVSKKVIYHAITAKKLRAARVNHRNIRTKAEWICAWLEASATPVEAPHR